MVYNYSYACFYYKNSAYHLKGPYLSCMHSITDLFNSAAEPQRATAPGSLFRPNPQQLLKSPPSMPVQGRCNVWNLFLLAQELDQFTGICRTMNRMSEACLPKGNFMTLRIY